LVRREAQAMQEYAAWLARDGRGGEPSRQREHVVPDVDDDTSESSRDEDVMVDEIDSDGQAAVGGDQGNQVDKKGPGQGCFLCHAHGHRVAACPFVHTNVNFKHVGTTQVDTGLLQKVRQNPAIYLANGVPNERFRREGGK
jgi:hypothetical protein